jgi:ABC-2 type transport system permease protein
MTGVPIAWHRVSALARKDVAELSRTPGAILPAIAMAFGALFPAFLVGLVIPAVSEQPLSASRDFAAAAARAAEVMPALAGLDPDARVQGFIALQFLLLLLMVPVVGSMALGSHAVIGEKQARALEPLLATPLTTLELLAAKTLTPFAVSTALMWASFGVYVAGFGAFGLPGAWRTLVTAESGLLIGVVGPLLSLVALQTAVIMSSRVSDARSAQQLGAFVILPLTAVFVAQLMGQFILGPAALLVSAVTLTLVNAGLAWAGIRVFDRESILMRWK